jgi:hypothetical protein
MYEAAKTSLEKCSSIDECREWVDKSAALASYARQSQDETLLKMAVRIQARAIKRCGELLKTYQAPGRRTDQPRNGADLKLTQEQAARKRWPLRPARETGHQYRQCAQGQV